MKSAWCWSACLGALTMFAVAARAGAQEADVPPPAPGEAATGARLAEPTYAPPGAYPPAPALHSPGPFAQPGPSPQPGPSTPTPPPLPPPALRARRLPERAPAGPPRELRWSANLVLQSQWHLDESARTFSGERAVTGGGLALWGRLVELAPGLHLAAGLDLVGESAAGQSALGRTRSEGTLYTAGARASFEVRPWLAPFARAGVGARHARFTVPLGELEASDERWGLAGIVSGGVGLRTPALSFGSLEQAFALSVELEGGLVLAGAQRVQPRIPAGSPDAIPVSGPTVVHVDGVRPFARLSAGVLF